MPVYNGRETVLGMDELLSKLRELKVTKSRAAIRKGTRAGAKIVAAEAKRLAPVLTGELRKQIKVRALKRSRKWFGVTVNLEKYYAAFLELGLKTHKLEARRFLTRAFNIKKDAALSAAMAAIQEEITK